MSLLPFLYLPITRASSKWHLTTCDLLLKYPKLSISTATQRQMYLRPALVLVVTTWEWPAAFQSALITGVWEDLEQSIYTAQGCSADIFLNKQQEVELHFTELKMELGSASHGDST